jgi:uncharacterized protein YciI
MKPILTLLLLTTLFASHCQTKSYSFVFLHKKPDAEQVEKGQLDKIMQGHMANIERLAKEAKLLVAGPFDGGGGIFILNTTSVDEAREWLSTDPGVQAHRWSIEILPYQPTIGALCTAKEPYEMVTYNFIRFKMTSAQNPDEVLKEHHEFIKGFDNIITAGNFGATGSLLITKGTYKQEDTASDPAVKKGTLIVESKKLWIAKGSFCEE